MKVIASEWIALHPEYHAELVAKRNSLHDAHHEVMDCLGQMMWESRRAGRPPDGAACIDAVQRRATLDA